MGPYFSVLLAILVSLFIFLGIPAGIQSAWAQATPSFILEQERDGAPARVMPPEDVAELNDPLFNLVLREQPGVSTLTELEGLLVGESGQEQTFVVSEEIESEDPGTPTRPATRRAVLTFSGENQGEVLDRNVMLSVAFNANEFPDVQNIEALGWDGQQGRYNYYKLDRQSTGAFSWKFRGSSVGAERLSPSQRVGTCLQCHINGAPVFKELPLPWNNWHSFSDRAGYLSSSWPVGQDPRIDENLRGAEDLETDAIVPAIRQFNATQIAASITETADPERLQVLDGPHLLRSLFATTEFNLISSNSQVGGLHPFSAFAPGPFSAVQVPDSFFLNADLIGGNGPAQIRGLQIAAANAFSERAAVEPEEYRQLIADAGVKLGGQAGDANFAWFVPQAGQIDNDRVEQLLSQGIVTPEFVAAVLAIDLETPLLSSAREALLRFVPVQFTFSPLPAGALPLEVQRHPDDLTQQTIAALIAENPEAGTPAAEFLALLQSEDPISILRERVVAVRDRIAAQLADPTTRLAELTRLHDLATARRQAILEDASLSPLDEFGLLFPIP